MKQHKVADYGKSIQLEPSDTWMCPCGVEHELGAYVAAHWDVFQTHECGCGVKRSFKCGLLMTPKKARKNGI